jgi:hypothetical protein
MYKVMKTKKLMGCLILSLISWGMYAQGQLISRLPEGGIGKQIVSIHSSSGQVNTEENAANLLVTNTTGNNTKWCQTDFDQPWVIFELSDYYNVDKFVFEDVVPFEGSGYANVEGYQIYVTNEPYDDVMGGWDDSDWKLVVDKTSEQAVFDVKTDELTTPEKARYVKFQVTQKGTRPNGNVDNAIRIYSFDIYGTFAEKIDRGNLVSVGKTIMTFYNALNVREVPIHILDANMSYIYNKWCFANLNDDENYKYVIIDLEKRYDITQFNVWDAKSVESGDNLSGCNIYVSTWSPNLSLISTIEDTNDCWTKIVDSNDDSDIKEYTGASEYWLPEEATVTGRFVKLEFPYDKVVGTSRVFQFEVFGTETVIPDDDATLSLLTVSAGALSPSFSGNETNYTLDVDKEVDKLVINAAATHDEATVTGAGEQTVNIGNDNVFEIEVTAKDGVTTKKYTITVTRADKSKVATLSTLSVSTGYLSPEFKPDVLEYAVDVASNVRNITLNATSANNATIEGLGNKTLSGAKNTFEITVIAEDGQTTEVYTVTVYVAPEGLISVSRSDGRGKRIVNIHSYSGKVSDTENPYKLLIGERLNTNGDKGNKWCDANDNYSWVIFSLPDIYYIDRIVFRDGELMESDNERVANVLNYAILVSTTGTDDSDFDEVLYASGGENINSEDIDADARYVKIEFYGNGNTVWIYGVDIYGALSERVDREGVVSVGKTIADYNFAWSDRETPANLIDGNIDRIEYNEWEDEIIVKHDPWAVDRSHNGAWVTIDLEAVYDIDKFILYDAADWITDYQVSVSMDNQNWAPAIEAADFDSIQLDPKPWVLAAPARGRYVKLEVPVASQNGSFTRIREFEVYGTYVTGIQSVEVDGDNLSVYPNPVARGESLQINTSGTLKLYSLQGALIHQQTISGSGSLATDQLAPGCYILQIANETGNRNAKLIVK